MIAEAKSTGTQDQHARILYGIRKAFYKLVLKSAANNGTLILQTEQTEQSGNNKIPAKDVLEILSKEYPEEIKAFHNDGYPLTAQS